MTEDRRRAAAAIGRQMRSSAPRFSGSVAVGIAVTAIVTTIGVGSIWAPFYADRDKLRGLHEEDGLNSQERREYEEFMKQIQSRKDEGVSGGGNSMWSRMNEQEGRK